MAETGLTKRLGVLYIRPLKEAREVEKIRKEMEKCHLILEDLDVRNHLWGEEAGDNNMNACGRKL